jgi:N-acetylglucosamine kinase-like BadF-type ATPase
VAAIAGLAPRVLARARRGDRLAARIVREAQTALAAQAHDVARALALRNVIAVGGAGSIMRNPWFAAGVRRALGHNGLRVRWCTPTDTAVDAAARLAVTLGATDGRRRRG